MYNPFRQRPYAFFERTPSERERRVPGRRHSHHGGYREPEESPEDADRAWDHDRRLLAENQALQADRGRLLRDNRALSQQLRGLRHEREYLAQLNQRLDEQERVIRDLERRLVRERRRLGEERAEREALDQERVERARRAAEELRHLKEEDRRWRATVVELSREVENYVRINMDKERRIRTLEEWLRRLGVGGVR